MYSFSAPATTCDPFPSHDPEQHPLPATRSDLRLVEIRPPATAGARTDKGRVPLDLAEKVLRRHAAAAETGRETLRAPKPSFRRENSATATPEVFERSLEEDQTPAPNEEIAGMTLDELPSSAPGHQGPRLKTLIASTLVLIVFGGGAIALAKSGLFATGQVSSREGAAQPIAVEPTLESLIESSLPALSDTTPDLAPADAARSDDAEELQIARAKEQLREAFAAQGVTAGTQTGPAEASGATGLSQGKIQARLDPRRIAAPAATVQHRPQDPPALAAATEAVAQPDATAESGTQEQTAQEVRDVPQAEDSSANAAAPKASGADPSFTTTGRIASAVNLRQSADKNAEILAVLPAGAEIRVGECGAWWCAIQHDGQTGFVGEKFLERTTPAD
ncbi:SH3 domain-containing protein [Labrenzia sp. 011]|uniref:SH3 domain-containing protein n=1 Tax=Labrenzia sp. 011 TaxID=2171494 RepID=UPI0014041DE0|nr:SH3 domain-containing protein [Labrenzia sp. 011]